MDLNDPELDVNVDATEDGTILNAQIAPTKTKLQKFESWLKKHFSW